jgi:NADPH:quinone reductase-like Zn-dependent oxidoreductase
VKAILIHSTGSPEVIRIEDVETPKPEEGQVLIQVAAAGVNHTDILARQGSYVTGEAALELPAILGTDVAGVVVGLGEGVFAPVQGTRVVALVTGGYAEYAVAPHELVYPPAAAAASMSSSTRWAVTSASRAWTAWRPLAGWSSTAWRVNDWLALRALSSCTRTSPSSATG